MAAQGFTIADLTHPIYEHSLPEWQKWRDVYIGGYYFINKYLQQYSTREDAGTFERRKMMTYNPAFAKSAVNEIKNAIFQRLVDISRVGGSDNYQRAVRGEDKGVDLLGSTMNAFLGRRALPELLTMSRVGIFVDMPRLSGITVHDARDKRPYLYIYRAEDIRTWRFDEYDSQSEFSSLLLRDYVFEYDKNLAMPIGETIRYRHMWVEGGKVHCKFYGESGAPVMASGQSFQNPSATKSAEEVTKKLRGEEDQPQYVEEEEIVLDIPRIPFVVLELSNSLLVDVANYQIALLNLASSDLAYVLQANFPFYTEQYEPRTQSAHIRPAGDDGGTSGDAGRGKVEEVRVGISRGRRYPKGLDRPGFIAPPTDPLKASIDKQEQMKAEIRQLVHLAVANLQPRDASAESKGMDNQGLESGLSYIGLELEHAERRIANYWAMYEKSKPATVRYPEKYSLRSEGDRREEAKELSALLLTVPSDTYRKEVCKRIVEVMLANKVSNDTLDEIRKEIDDSDGVTAEVDVIAKHVEIGILDLELASRLCGYPEGTVEKASKDHTDRLTRIAQSQSAKSNTVVPDGQGKARGLPDLDGQAGATGSKEKQASKDTTGDGSVTDKVRGEGQ